MPSEKIVAIFRGAFADSPVVKAAMLNSNKK